MIGDNPNLQQMHHALGAAMFKAGVVMEPDVAYAVVERLCDEFGQPRIYDQIILDPPNTELAAQKLERESVEMKADLAALEGAGLSHFQGKWFEALTYCLQNLRRPDGLRTFVRMPLYSTAQLVSKLFTEDGTARTLTEVLGTFGVIYPELEIPTGPALDLPQPLGLS